jgi:hypothetical protein
MWTLLARATGEDAMTTFVRYELPDGGEVYFETPDSALVTPRGGDATVIDKGKLANQVDNIAKAAAATAQSMRRLLEPDELELEFGISMEGSTNWWFIVSAKTEGSIKVTLKWSRVDATGRADAAAPGDPA